MNIFKIIVKGVLGLLTIVAIIIIAVVILIAFWFWDLGRGYVVNVYDSDSGKPLQNAKVTAEYEIGIDGWGKKIFLTDGRGKAVIEGGTAGRLVSFLVEKDGYHFGGINSYQKAFSGHKYTIKLNKYKNPQNLILATITFHEKDKADFLDAILNKDINKIKNLPSGTEISKVDFDFPEVSNSEAEKNHTGRGTAIIRFYGAGGVQQLSGGGEKTLMTDYDYALDNLFLAPANGYSKELSLVSGGEYIAKLRDGKHYMKFTTFISKDLDGINYAKITFYIQPLENNNLESNLTSLESKLRSIISKDPYGNVYDSSLDKSILANIYDFPSDRKEITSYNISVFQALK